MNIVVEKDRDNLGSIIGQDIIDTAKKLLDNKDIVTLALCGGRSINQVLSYFRHSRDDAWKNIHIFMVDERLVSINDPQSNYKLSYDSFAKDLVDNNILPKGNLHPFMVNKDKDDFGASNYKKVLDDYGGMFDIVLLSSGEDGHIAGLYPNHPALTIKGKEFLILDDSPKPPKDRMTASVELVAGAIPFLIFMGSSKRDALNAFSNPRLGIVDCPAKMVLRMESPKVYTDLTYK
ncbi:MAG: 6-phosphogluconolactonase [Candidatus Woesearchaeota archaeon]